jgi:hypothetical protein
MTANLIRITRGSGTLYEVEAQVMELADLLRVSRIPCQQALVNERQNHFPHIWVHETTVERINEVLINNC